MISAEGQVAGEGVGKRIAIALYDYDGVTEEELDFDEGEQFEILSSDDPEWLYVRRLDMLEDEPNEGYVPKTYCKVSSSISDRL